MKAKRIDSIKEYVMEQKSVSIYQLCDKFQVSKNTIRRDIDLLVEEGAIRKVYGGVIANTKATTPTGFHQLRPFEERNQSNMDAKYALAQRAASYVEDHDTIFLDSGTTTQNMIPYLEHVQDLTILTHSVPALVKLMDYKNIKVISLPGLLLRGTASMIGNCTTSYLSSFNITKAFMACTGLNFQNQVTNATYEEYEIKKVALERSSKHYLLADSEKFGHSGIMTYSSITNFDCIITDSLPPSEYVAYLKEQSIILDLP